MKQNDISVITSKNDLEETRTDSEIEEHYHCARVWENTFKELGEDALRRVITYMKTNEGDAFVYVGNPGTRWPPKKINTVYYSIVPKNSTGIIGKPLLVLEQEYNGAPGSIKILVKTPDKNIEILAKEAADNFNKEKQTNFEVIIENGSEKYSGHY